MTIKSIKRLALFVVLLGFCLSLLYRFSVLSPTYSLSCIYIGLLTGLSILVHWRTMDAIQEGSHTKATRIIISMISIKLFGSLVLLAIFYWWQPDAARDFIVSFLLIYFSFTLYEIFSLQRAEKDSTRLSTLNTPE